MCPDCVLQHLFGQEYGVFVAHWVLEHLLGQDLGVILAVRVLERLLEHVKERDLAVFSLF